MVGMWKTDIRIDLNDQERQELERLERSQVAPHLDVCLRRQLIATEPHEQGKRLLDRIVAMLVKLSRAMRDD